MIKRQDKPIIEYRVIQNLTRKRFRKAMHLKAVLQDLEERGFIHQKEEGRKKLLEWMGKAIGTLFKFQDIGISCDLLVTPYIIIFPVSLVIIQ